MNVHPTIVNKKHARKRQADKENWKRNIAKKLRYAPKSLPNNAAGVCAHNSKALQCSKITMQDLQILHTNFYKFQNKKDQDIVLFKYCSIQPVKPRKNCIGKKKFTTKFSVFIRNQKVPICQKFFLNVFGIKKYRVNYLMKKLYETGEFAQESRGGDRKSTKYLPQRVSVHTFIQSLECVESHYCRKTKHAERKYLPTGWNLQKLFYKGYQKTPTANPDVKLSYFRNIFNTCYNIGFGTPSTDKCSKCLEYTEKIKVEKDGAKKNVLITEKRVHKLRANAFFQKFKDTAPEVKIISFDCQKNLPLPKLADQITYYSRQLYFYHLAVVEGSSRMPLNKDNVFAYYCTENEYSKDSNLIASAVYDRLCKTDKTGIKTIRLMADGCGGQNKNSIVISMCCKWLLENLSIKTIEVVFPVTGHSYMPADRLFGVIEKKLRTKETMLHPDEISDIINETATLVKIGTDCKVQDWRTEAKNVIKPTTSWNVKFNECKRFIIKRSKRFGNVLVRGEALYKSDLGSSHNICKPRKLIAMINPSDLPTIVPVNKKKLKDVEKLLNTHFGEDWRNLPTLEFYENMLIAQDALTCAPQQEITYCDEATEESSDLRI